MKKIVPLLLMSCLALVACSKPQGTATTTVSHIEDNGHQVTQSSIVLSDYAMRAALGNNLSTAAYVTIKNAGSLNDRLLGASCACASSATLHTMQMKGSVMEMDEAPQGFPLRPGEVLTFRPGGNHIMLTGLKSHPKEGDKVAVSLVFEKAGVITIEMPVSVAPLSSSSTPDTSPQGAMSAMKM